ncbi:MAG TPA: sigma-70 family RNA polymerase sigma factor [Polyangia bacterium]|nr:sigma-70 family RNA polymerase sigma factor [Polyangia bacterium]
MTYPTGHARLRLLTPAHGAPDQTPDVELARALIAGEPHAPEIMWDRYAPLVYRIVSRALGPDAEVEDVTQEIFYRLFNRVGSLRKPEALRSFVVSFALRIVKWELRRRRARRWLTLSETGEVPDDQLLFVTADTRYALRRLYRLLDQLATRDRLVLVLRHVEGMTLEEIAEALSISLATVKRSLRHATARLSALVDSDAALRKPGVKVVGRRPRK